MYAVTQYRKTAGWKLFQQDEDYNFSTAGDNLVCPVCQGLVGTFNGVDVPIYFSAWRRRGQNVVYPNTHESLKGEVPYLHGDCRCSLTWFDYLPVLAERLFTEMEVAAG